jgi:hypothetical protein
MGSRNLGKEKNHGRRRRLEERKVGGIETLKRQKLGWKKSGEASWREKKVGSASRNKER